MKKEIQRKMMEKPGMPTPTEKRRVTGQELVTNKNHVHKRARKERIDGNKN